MNFRLTMVLTVVLLIILGCFIAFTRWNGAAKPGAEGPKNALLTVKPESLTDITYEEDGTKKMAFAKEGTSWTMTFPVKAAVEQWRVEDLARTLAGLTFKEKFEPEGSGVNSPEVTGTASPKHVVTLTDDKGVSYRVGLGNRTVGGIYAVVNTAKTIYRLDGDPLEGLEGDAGDFRDKTIKQLPVEKIAELTVQRKDQKDHGVTVRRAGEKWLIEKPIAARANEAAITEITNELKAINATSFVDLSKDMPATGLNPPRLRVTAVLNDGSAAASMPAGSATKPAGTTVTLELGYYTDPIDKTAVYASLAGSSQVFTFSAASFDKLNQGLQQLRDPAISPARIGEATGVTVTTQGKTVVKVERKDGKWVLESATPAVVAGDLEVGNWLGDLQNLRAIKFVDDAGDLKSIGLDPPMSRIEMVIPGQSQHEVILVGKPESADKVTPMMRQGEPTVYLVQTADAQAIVQSDLTLRDKTVERLPTEKIRGIKVEGAGASEGGFELLRAGTVWNVKSGEKSVKADEGKVTGLLAEFTPLTAAKYVAEKAESGGKPDLTATVEVMEPVVNEAATKPAAAIAATSPATSTAPAVKLPAGLMGEPAGVDQVKAVKRVLKLYKTGSGNAVVWKAVWDGADPQWTFEPTAGLVKDLTTEVYAAPAAATQAGK